MSIQHVFSLFLAVATTASMGCFGGLRGGIGCASCGSGGQTNCDSCDTDYGPGCGIAEASCEFPSCGVADDCPSCGVADDCPSCGVAEASCCIEDAECGVPSGCSEDVVGCGTPVVGNCRLLQRIRDALCGNYSYGSETYWSEWYNDPPSECESCNRQGAYLGSRGRTYQAPSSRRPRMARDELNFGEELREANGQGETIYR